MPQMYEVFIGDFPLIFCRECNPLADKEVTHLRKLPGPKSVERWLKEKPFLPKVFSDPDPDAAFNAFLKQFGIIEAAGGLVRSAPGNYLMIYRKGKWDLPKGKVDKGETHPEAAIREVLEETGVGPARIISPMPQTMHTYMLKGEPVIKITRWYSMSVDSEPPTVPEEKESIHSAVWVSPDLLPQKLIVSYGAVKQLMSTWVGITPSL